MPGGPSSNRRNNPQRTRTIQIESGSVAVVPDFQEEPHEHAEHLEMPEVAVKVEEIEEENRTIPSVENISQDPVVLTQQEEIKSERVGEEECVVQEDESWYDHLSRMFANPNQRRGTDPEGSLRQSGCRTSTPSRNRSKLSDSEGRDRSRSPSSPKLLVLPPYERLNPMFFSENSPPRESSSEDSNVSQSSVPSAIHSSTNSLEPGISDRIDKEENRCTCPISYQCSHRYSTKLNCRPLVLEPMAPWEERSQEDFERYVFFFRFADLPDQRVRHRKANLQGEKTTTDLTLVSIVGIIDNFEKAATRVKRKREVKNMENWVLAMEDVTLVDNSQQEAASNQVVPRLSNFLSSQNQTLRRSGQLPGYIEEELTVLQRKWMKGDFSGAIKRGLKIVQTHDLNNILRRSAYQLDKTYEFYTSALYFGAGDLVNGQLWMSRLELCRDGVHAPPIAGISGGAQKGAYSIVLGEFDEKNNEGYADIDMGEVIEYMGTALKDIDDLGPTNEEDPHMHNPNSWNPTRKPTNATAAMMKSFETGKPVRVIRSCKMHSMVKNKPRLGFRYDGLYRVVGKTPMKEARQIWSFRMERLIGQGHLRGFKRDQAQPDSNGRRKGHQYIGK